MGTVNNDWILKQFWQSPCHAIELFVFATLPLTCSQHIGVQMTRKTLGHCPPMVASIAVAQVFPKLPVPAVGTHTLAEATSGIHACNCLAENHHQQQSPKLEVHNLGVEACTVLSLLLLMTPPCDSSILYESCTGCASCAGWDRNPEIQWPTCWAQFAMLL